MNKVSRASIYDAPTLWVEIDDLRIPCAVPTVAVTECIMNKAEQVVNFSSEMSKDQYDFAFELLAIILSCNHNFVHFSPEELKAKRITVTHIIGILTDWIQFIGDLVNQKN